MHSMTLTRLDLKQITLIIDKSLDKKLDKKFESLATKKELLSTRNEIMAYIDGKVETFREEMRAGFANMPTKDELLGIMDVVHGRYKRIDDEHDYLANQVRRHSDEIFELQKKVGI